MPQIERHDITETEGPIMVRDLSKTPCRTPAEGRDGVTNIPTWKFLSIREAILAALDDAGDAGVPFSQLKDAVADRLSAEDLADLGSVGWHMTSVKLEMEVRGEVGRKVGSGPQIVIRTTE